MLMSGHLLPPGSASGSGIARVGRRAAPAAMGNRPHGLGRPRPIRRPSRIRGSPPSDPPAPHYDGAALEAGSGSGEDRRVRPARGRKLLAGVGPPPETRPPTRTEVLGQKSSRGPPGVPAS